MIDKALEQITQADLEALVVEAATEGRRLDFKVAFPDGADKAVRELLADVTSFANTDGGDIIVGIRDDGNGVAAEAVGIPTDNLDKELLRIEGQIRDCIDPRLPAFHVRTVSLDTGTAVLVLRVGASLLAPHRVTHKGSSRFYARNSRGKFEMSTGELRLAFAATDEMPRKVRDLHSRAVNATSGVDMPCRLADDPMVILTIAPMSILREARDVSVTRETAVLPARGAGYHFVTGLDGMIVHSLIDEASGGVRTWAVNHRRGYIDFAWAIGRTTENGPTIWRKYFEEELLSAARSAVARLRSYGIDGPWVAMVTLQGIGGYSVVMAEHYRSDPAWQDPAYLGEVVDDSLEAASLQPFIERFWRLFGMDQAPR